MRIVPSPTGTLPVTIGVLAIGFSTPVATGAAVACPDRKVICMVGDGSAMYSVQALWTQARESLPVTTIVFANNTYNILKQEYSNMKAGPAPGPAALAMIDIDRPTIDWRAMAKSMHDVSDPRNASILINVNGELKRRGEALVSVFDSGFMLGDGVWEGLRIHGGGYRAGRGRRIHTGFH